MMRVIIIANDISQSYRGGGISTGYYSVEKIFLWGFIP